MKFKSMSRQEIETALSHPFDEFTYTYNIEYKLKVIEIQLLLDIRDLLTQDVKIKLDKRKSK